MAWAAGGTAVGGIVGGPVGAMVGGVAGLIFYFQVMFLILSVQCIPFSLFVHYLWGILKVILANNFSAALYCNSL